MKAVVLVGGEGTRLRPLTQTTPKPLIPVMDRRFLDHVLDHLGRHGVEEAILSSPYLEETFLPFVAARADTEPTIRWITETEPLGTGGAILQAVDHLATAEPVLALNGDILTDLDLTAMSAFHRERRASVTISLTHVEDARPFGLVPTDDRGRVEEFREKPADPIPGDVNAGTYVLDPAALQGFDRGRNLSIERDIFPAVIADGRPVYGFLSHGYWMDLGTPAKYLQAHFDIFEGRVEGLRYPAPWVHVGAAVSLRAHLGRWVAVGEGAVVDDDARIEDSVLHPGARVHAGARVAGTILGPNAQVGTGASVSGCVLGEGAQVAAGAVVDDQRVAGLPA
ncbi:MAG: NDP-sugar synthase [Actinobacteria bacterium]|nr:NDP-sugar synthase [Actinomycetota bacterium]